MKSHPHEKAIGRESRKFPFTNSDPGRCGGGNKTIADEFKHHRLCSCAEKSLPSRLGRGGSDSPANGNGKSDFDKHDFRNHLHYLISLNPGISLKKLIVRTGQKRSTIRYHLEKIESEGRVKSKTVAGKKCYCAMGSPKAVIENSFLKNDVMVHELLKFMHCEETPLYKLIQFMQESCNLSRSGAYAVVKRAEHEGHIVRRKRQSTVLIQRVSSW